ncbi:unnamed protein product [Didymodactylos carnosus]|uniref:Uncharacterized protein n=1 Tax=Didymodactylos carnosus TaxID=1234261 RepID=A0A816A1R1_9BILA|nr:unnamed protein product [Didymodactylos carnosus]CAF4462895.1 unnamed protein product [Didymodactylos carnosus]
MNENSGTGQRQISPRMEDNIIIHDSQPSSSQEPLLTRKPAKRRAVWSSTSPNAPGISILTFRMDIPANISFAPASEAISNKFYTTSQQPAPLVIITLPD